ncbi:SDR family oxidoreductase [Brachybacterium fresconis]|uniref:NADP-dependent 3-hydroxy acid dehydrogenase YdfG n=1 Tax=Brachybacterium fresconis TaxID=173363 RepID=A0ABS4YPJ7_9MICO|nr:SDR family oxidoreductase [Brachybacterium fresconis]MBP2410724.1 NADP-dependent 3-hydroxy acid dehydrogenase YdfG [Brachybacterium fresconis]
MIDSTAAAPAPRSSAPDAAPLTAVVTGASSGIGRATAARLVADGWRVLAVARREDRLAELAAETGCEVLGVDVTSDESVERLVARTEELFAGSLNAVVHVAGGALGVEPAAEADLAKWQRMYDINVLGAVRVTRALLPALRTSGRGDLLFVTSVAAQEAYPGGSGYNAAKAGEHMLAGALRLELNGEPIRVIEVAPGMVATEEFSLVRLGDRAAADAVYDGVENPLTAEDCADVIAYALGAPHHVNLDLVTVRPLAQAAAHRVARHQGI